jgi:hypothetical protein
MRNIVAPNYSGLAGSTNGRAYAGVDSHGAFHNVTTNSSSISVAFDSYGIGPKVMPFPRNSNITAAVPSGANVVALNSQNQMNFYTPQAKGAVWIYPGSYNIGVAVTPISADGSSVPPIYLHVIYPNAPTPPPSDPNYNAEVTIGLVVLGFGVVSLAFGIPALFAAAAEVGAETIFDFDVVAALVGVITGITGTLGGLVTLGMQTYYNYDTTGSTNPYTNDPSGPPPIVSDPEATPNANY